MSYFGTIYADTELPSRARAVYMYLRDRADSEGKCWPGIKTIASDMRLSRSTVKRALTDLEQHGYLQKIPRYPHGHFPVFQNFNHMQYQIKDPKGFAEMLDTCKRSHATVTMGAAHPTCIPCSKAVKKAQSSAKGGLRPFTEPRGGS